MDHHPLRRARGALLVSFLVQGACFAVLVTRIPALQRRYGVGDGMLTVLLAAVPVVAGVGSVAAEALAKRFGLHRVLRAVQPVVCLSLIALGAGDAQWQLALCLPVFGLALGAVDATANMQGVALQQRYGRSIMLGFHAAFSLGGIAGASAAWAGAHWHLALLTLYTAAACVTVPAALTAGHWYPGRPPASPAEPGGEPAFSWRPLVPLCAVMAIAYIADSTVSNWSAKYLQDVLHSSDQLATVPYNAYLVATLAGRSVGDLGVRRWGPAVMVRYGAVLAAVGFAVVATAGGAWTGLLGFTTLGLGICVVVPQTFAAAGRLYGDAPGLAQSPHAADAAVARLNIFNYVGVLLGSPLVGAIGGAWSYRAAMAVPMVLVLVILGLVQPFRVPGPIPLRP
jgi:predicted MFS family arabinose efflux permease